MPHNPIIRQTKLGTSPPDIGRTQRGVLYDGHDYYDLPPKLGFLDRQNRRNHILTVVDCSRHTWKWPLRLLSGDNQQVIEWDAELTYWVTDAKTLVRRQVIDVENELKQALLPAMAAVAARYRLPAHQATAAQLVRAIQEASIWKACGLELDPDVKLAPRLSADDRRAIDEANQLDKATHTPRAYHRTAELPTSEALYKLDATVALAIQIADRDGFDSLADLENTVETLWAGKIRRALARECRRFTYGQLAEAETALDRLLDDEAFDDHGLHVVSASVELKLGAAAAEHARADNERRRTFTDDIARREHYRAMGFKDKVDALAVALGKGDMSAREAISYFNEEERRNIWVPIEALEKLKDLDTLDSDAEAVAARFILGKSLSESTRQSPSDTPNQVNLQEAMGLLGGAPLNPPPALTDSRAAEDTDA